MSTNKQALRVALIQCHIYDNDPTANLECLEAELRGLAGRADLAVLPETFTTGFSGEAVAWADEWQGGRVLPWLRQLSSETGMAIAGSYLIKEGGEYFNRFVLVDSAGEVQSQDKRHLFVLGGESKMLSRAQARRVLHYRGWRIMPLVCYDLRFPVWSRLQGLDYDLMITVAAWPRSRRLVWQTLLKARAMENLAYAVGVNRIGTDAEGLSYAGDSAVIDPRGRELAVAPEDEHSVLIVTLEPEPLEELRRKFPVWQDADPFTLTDN